MSQSQSKDTFMLSFAENVPVCPVQHPEVINGPLVLSETGLIQKDY